MDWLYAKLILLSFVCASIYIFLSYSKYLHKQWKIERRADRDLQRALAVIEIRKQYPWFDPNEHMIRKDGVIACSTCGGNCGQCGETGRLGNIGFSFDRIVDKYEEGRMKK